MSDSITQMNTAPFEAVGEALPRDTLVVNYFNYFTEVEEHFVRRRGKHLMISSLDWAIIESWKDMGIPLHIVLRGIDRVFDAYEANHRAASGRLINSLLYCQQEVLSCFEDYKHARVGATAQSAPCSDAPPAAPPPFSKQTIVEYVSGRGPLLQQFAASFQTPSSMELVQQAVERTKTRLDHMVQDMESAHTLDLEAVEQELSRLETMLYEALLQCVPPEELEDVRKEAKRQLREYKKRMEPHIYRQTMDHYVAKRLREQYRLPRLSLFYMT